MDIRYYTRDESGIFDGPRVSTGWDSIEDFLFYYERQDRAPEREELVGWPDDAVVWYGDLGVVE